MRPSINRERQTKVSFLFGFIFNDLQSLEMLARTCANETLIESEFP
jgi:hypothetical protein